MTLLPGYDAWKLASPYEDQPEPREEDVRIPFAELIDAEGVDVFNDWLSDELAGDIIDYQPLSVDGADVIIRVRYHPEES